MAFQVLERDAHEREVFERTYQNLREKFSLDLRFIFEIFQIQPATEFEQSLQKLAKREDLSSEECEAGVKALLDESFSVVYKAAFLQGLRVKRESDSENLALYGKLFELAPRETLDDLELPLVDLSDPYDGMTRHAHLTFLVAVVLSAMKVPVVIHSSCDLGPKYGKTVLDIMGPTRPLDLESGSLALREVGMAVLDQEQVFPKLNALKPMRNEMRKRPFLATVEKMLMPLRSKNKNILVTGYVHKAYKTAIPKMIMDHGEYDEILLVKGVEGSVLLDPSKKIPAIYSDGNQFQELELSHVIKGVSPKSELNPCDISQILKGEDERWLAIEFTVLKILEITLGGVQSEDIIREMARLKNEELFLAQFKKVRDFYCRSGEYA
jgi:anthranilate phosphoribosyltransferase